MTDVPIDPRRFDQERSRAVAALDLAFSQGQNFLTKSISADSTFTFSGSVPSGRGAIIVLELTVTGATRTTTWPASVKWPTGTALALPVGVYLISFTTVNAGATWRGNLGSVYAS